MEKTADRAYARLKEDGENERNGGPSSLASSPLAKPPTLGYLAQRVHVFSKRKTNGPLCKTVMAAAAASTTPAGTTPTRKKVLEAVQAFESINQVTASKRIKISSPRAGASTLLETPSKDLANKTPVSSAGLDLINKLAENKDVTKGDVVSPTQTLLDDALAIPERKLNKAGAGLVDDEQTSLDMARLLRKPTVVVGSCNENVKSAEVSDCSRHQPLRDFDASSENDQKMDIFLQAAGIAESTKTAASANEDKTACDKAEAETTSVNPNNKSFASINSEAYESMSRMAQAIFSFSEKMSTDLHKAANTVLRTQDKHAIEPGFKDKMHAMIRKRVVNEAAKEARDKFPIRTSNVITTMKNAKLTGDLLSGNDEMEITRVENKPMRLVEVVFDNVELPAGRNQRPTAGSHTHCLGNPGSTLSDDRSLEHSTLCHNPMEPTDQEKAILRLAPKASWEYSSDEESAEEGISDLVHGLTSVEKLLALTPIDHLAILDAALMIQPAAPNAATLLEESTEEGTASCGLSYTRDDTLDNLDFTQDDTTLLADDEATFDQDETKDDFLQQQSYLNGSLMVDDKERLSVPNIDADHRYGRNTVEEFGDSMGSDGEESETFAEEDSIEARSTCGQEFKVATRSQLSGSSTEVTANGDTKLYQSVHVPISTPVSILPMDDSVISGLNSTWPSVTLFNKGEAIDEASPLFGDAINTDLVRGEVDFRSNEITAKQHDTSGHGIDNILGILQPAVDEKTASDTISPSIGLRKCRNSKDSSQPTSVCVDAEISLSTDVQDASRTEEATLQALIERPITDNNEDATGHCLLENSLNESGCGVDTEGGGRLWNLIVAQTSGYCSGDKAVDDVTEEYDQTTSVAATDSPTANDRLPQRDQPVHTYNLSLLLPMVSEVNADEDEDDIRSKSHIYDNPALTDVRRILCMENADSLICNDDVAAAVPSQTESRNEMVYTGSKSTQASQKLRIPERIHGRNAAASTIEKNSGRTRHAAKVAIARGSIRRGQGSLTKNSRSDAASPAKPQRRQCDAFSKFVDTRDSSPVETGLYIAEMMGQEIVQVASDLISVCDEISKSGTSREPRFSWLRCW